MIFPMLASLWIAALPLIVLLLTFQLIGSILMSMSSIVTNLLATVFLIGAVAGSIADAPGRQRMRQLSAAFFFARFYKLEWFRGWPYTGKHPIPTTE